jgi:hypothetical protein
VVIVFSVERSESLIMWSQEGGQHDLHWVKMKLHISIIVEFVRWGRTISRFLLDFSYIHCCQSGAMLDRCRSTFPPVSFQPFRVPGSMAGKRSEAISDLRSMDASFGAGKLMT